MSRFILGSGVAVALLGVTGQQTQAVIPYQQGYESDASGWTTRPGSTITRVPSGGGTLGAPSSSGSFHAEITSEQDYYDPDLHYGDGGYTQLGGPQAAYGGDFYQGVDVYVNLSTWAPPTNPSVPAFIIDSSPRNRTNDSSDFRDEQNFQLSIPTANTVNVAAAGTQFGTITKTGWYRFLESFETTGSTVANKFYVVDLAENQLVGTTTGTSSMPSSELGGNSYLWFTVWQNGFAGDIMAIDNVKTDLLPVPLPPTDPWRVADINSDGKVSVGDLGILATHFNETTVGGKSVGDINLDGSVTVGDLGILATYFGQPAGSGAVSFADAVKEFPNLPANAVPEPAALGLLALVAPAFMRRGARRR